MYKNGQGLHRTFVFTLAQQKMPTNLYKSRVYIWDSTVFFSYVNQSSPLNSSSATSNGETSLSFNHYCAAGYILAYAQLIVIYLIESTITDSIITDSID